MNNKVSKALIWDILGTLFSQGTGIIVSIFLARLLTPSEFGVVAIALVFIQILSTFTDFGLQQGLIQQKNTSLETYSSVFILNLIFGVSLFILFQFLAPIVAQFYENEIIEKLIRYLSILLIINPFSSVQNTILVKNLAFKVLTIRTVISRIIGGTIGIILAFYDYGVYALVWQEIISSCINCILLWGLSTWRPAFLYSSKEIKKIFRFSLYMFLTQILNRIINTLDVLLIGKLFSASTLGYYGRAQSLMNIIRNYSSKSLNSVFFPVLSKLQDKDEEFEDTFCKVYALISFGIFLIAGILILSSELIILTLFGEQWTESIFIFKILMFKIFSFPTNSFLITALVAKGKSKENFIQGLIRNFLRATTYIAAVFYGFQAFLVTTIVVAYAGTIYNNIVVSHYLKISIKKQFIEQFSFGIIFLLLLVLINSLNITFSSILVGTIIKAIFFTSFYILFSYFFRKKVMKMIYYTILQLIIK